MNTRSILGNALCAATLLTAVSALSACDVDDEFGQEILDEDEDDSIELRSASAISANKWRIRNAAVQANTGQWVFREIDFCADAACNQPIAGGTAFDSGASEAWSVAANAFDDDTTTMWKTFDTNVAGQSYIGLDFGVPTSVAGLRIQTDNVVYSVDSLYVEYFDDNTQAWVTADYLSKIPTFTTVTYPVQVRSAFPTQWRVRNAVAQSNSGQIVLRELDFCADASCTTPFSGGTAFDSGASEAWSLPANAFDDDTTTMWKTFDSNVAGQSFLGMDFGEITEVQGIDMQTDNVVYAVDSMYVEYYDIVKQEWVIADYLGNLPAFTTVNRAVQMRDRFPTQWRVRNAAAQANSGQLVIRELDFCADPACATPLTGGTAVDSGASQAWSLPANAFDNDTTTMWKTFDSGVVGQSFLGMDFGEVVEPQGLFFQADNVVYSVDSMYVEYYDIIAGEWVSSDYLDALPTFTNVTRTLSGTPTLSPVSRLLLDGSVANSAAGGDPGAVVGASYTSDVAPIITANAGALLLDGVDDYATIPDSSTTDFGNQDFTVALWVKPGVQTDLSHGDNDVVEKWAGGGGYPFVIRYINQNSANEGKLAAARYDGSNNPSILSSATINDGAYHHVAFVKSGSALRLYIDGVQQGADVVDTTNGNTTNNSPVYLGRRGQAAPFDNFFAGSLDDLNIFDRGLSEAEVAALIAR